MNEQSGAIERLRPCPSSPNCVCSEAGTENKHAIEALAFDEDRESAWQRVQTAITAIGGKIVEQDAHCLRAEFRSRLMRFVDDLECRMDSENNCIQLRSASRVGYSDLGVNRKRVEKLREEFRRSG